MKISTVFFVIILVSLSITSNTLAKDTLVVEQSTFNARLNWAEQSPTIQLFLGFCTPWLSDVQYNDYQVPFLSDLTPEKSIEARLGTTTEKVLYPEHGVASYDFSALFFKYIGRSDALGNNQEDYDFLLKQLQFGIFSASGYGFKSESGAFGIYLYNGGSLNWNDISYSNNVDPRIESFDNGKALDTYDGSLRFGQSFESGVKLRLFGPINVIGAFERNIVYPRHMFWKWTVSGIIEGVASGCVDAFSKMIMKKSPVIGPFTYFVLKTAVNYGMYELRRGNMNWPYKTSPPLIVDSWKIGVSFEF